MELNNLKPAIGATKASTRKGRGPGSGKGGTSTRGHKGAKQRSGYSRKIGFEGGQMPLQRRLPKFGFKPLCRCTYKAINLDTLTALAQEKQLTAIDIETLRSAGLVAKAEPVKILAKGHISTPLTVTANEFSASARAAIEGAGGQCIEQK